MKYKHKQLLYSVIFFAFIFLGFKAYSTIKSSSIHEHILVNDVQSVTIRGYGTRTASSEEMQNIVKWFNTINNVQENTEFAGTTNSSSIEITLKSNKKISLFYPGRVYQDFEIQRYNKKGKYISYLGNQSDIKKILEEASKH